MLADVIRMCLGSAFTEPVEFFIEYLAVKMGMAADVDSWCCHNELTHSWWLANVYFHMLLS